MPGRIKQMIDFIIKQRAQGNPMLERVIKTKLILKGINPSKYNLESADDPAVINKLQILINDFK
jgi:hypothetical protein